MLQLTTLPRLWQKTLFSPNSLTGMRVPMSLTKLEQLPGTVGGCGGPGGGGEGGLGSRQRHVDIPNGGARHDRMLSSYEFL